MKVDRPSSADRVAAGKAVRAKVPLESHAEFQPAKKRDPIALLLRQAKTRVPELVPVRHGRMLVSPFTFYRGAALVMAADLHTTPTSGIRTQLCGDAHLSNFGAYASPERRLFFDINDFDETLPGPFEWDVKRLAASLVVAGRDRGLTTKQCRKASLTAVGMYRTSMRTFATQTILDVWYAHLDVEEVLAATQVTIMQSQFKESKRELKRTESLMAKAHTRDNLQATNKLTTMVDGRRRIISNPPLIIPIEQAMGLDIDRESTAIRGLIGSYRQTLRSDRQHLFEQFRLTDVARKVVGVGSVGTLAWILLFESTRADEVLLLQAKQAQVSALSQYAGATEYSNEGERVVAGQHLMQASSDIFLGWFAAQPVGLPEADYYVRQLRDWKMSAPIETMHPGGLADYARLCGWTLARAHARAGDRMELAGYLGSSTRFENAVSDFAETYADQNARDHEALQAAVAAGRVKAEMGV